MRSKFLILGQGYIGQRLQESFACPITKQRIHSFKDVEKIVSRYHPKVLINCVGHTGAHNVDDCEIYPDKTITANTFVPLLLAEAALRHGIQLVHLSSGCIYHYDHARSRPLTEKDIPNYFHLYYSRTKIYAERCLNVLAQQYPILITRLRIPLDDRPHPRSILTKLITFKKIIDIPNSLTYVPDFIRALKFLIRKRARGIYNVTNKGSLRYPRLLKVYQKYDSDYQFDVIPYRKLGMNRTNLVLSCRKLEQAGFPVRHIHDTLEEAVQGFFRNRI